MLTDCALFGLYIVTQSKYSRDEYLHVCQLKNVLKGQRLSMSKHLGYDSYGSYLYDEKDRKMWPSKVLK